MASLSPEKLRRMRNKYDHNVARFLAGWMINERKLITYTQLGEAFGRPARGWGDTLGGIALRCHENNLPLLPVVVVRTGSDLPSEDAILYHELGLAGIGDIHEMQQRCFDYDWASSPLGR